MLCIIKQLRKMTSVNNYTEYKKLKKDIERLGFWMGLGFGGKEECISKIELAMFHLGEHLKKTYEDPEKVFDIYGSQFVHLCRYGGMHGFFGYGQSLHKIKLKPVY